MEKEELNACYQQPPCLGDFPRALLSCHFRRIPQIVHLIPQHIGGAHQGDILHPQHLKRRPPRHQRLQP